MRVNGEVPVPPALVASKVIGETAAIVGVPDIRPVLVLTDNPVGRSCCIKTRGTVCGCNLIILKACPTAPEAVVALVITGAGVETKIYGVGLISMSEKCPNPYRGSFHLKEGLYTPFE